MNQNNITMDNENLDLTKILRVGDKVYSPICGECEVTSFENGSIWVHTSKSKIQLDFGPDGRFMCNGEPLLFPSRDCRDWSKFERPRWRAEKGEQRVDARR